MLQRGGTATIVGMIPVGTHLEIHGPEFLQERTLQGSNMGSNRFRVDMPRFVDFYLQGRLHLDDLISRTIKLEDVNESWHVDAKPVRSHIGSLQCSFHEKFRAVQFDIHTDRNHSDDRCGATAGDHLKRLFCRLFQTDSFEGVMHAATPRFVRSDRRGATDPACRNPRSVACRRETGSIPYWIPAVFFP